MDYRVKHGNDGEGESKIKTDSSCHQSRVSKKRNPIKCSHTHRMGCAAGWPAATRLNKDVREGGLPKEIPKKLASFTRDVPRGDDF